MWKALKRLPKESRDHIPPLPPTTWSLSHTKDDEVTRERHAALAKCVRDALRLRGATALPEVRAFLELDTPQRKATPKHA